MEVSIVILIDRVFKGRKKTMKRKNIRMSKKPTFIYPLLLILLIYSGCNDETTKR